jgi:hypothetical protein
MADRQGEEKKPEEKKPEEEKGGKCVIDPKYMKLVTLITLLVSDFDVVLTRAPPGTRTPKRVSAHRLFRVSSTKRRLRGRCCARSRLPQLLAPHYLLTVDLCDRAALQSAPLSRT